MTTDSKVSASRYLSRLNLNTPANAYPIKTYWCRVAFGRFERFNAKEQRHSFFELHLCLAGSCKFSVEDRESVLSAGSFILVPPGKRHRIIGVGADFEKLVWGFSVESESDSDSLSLECFACTVPTEADPSFFLSVERILSEGERGAALDTDIIRNELYYMYTLLLRRFNASKKQNITLKAGVRAAVIRDFIAENLSSSLSVSDIAAQFYMSERQLERICHEEYRITAGELKRKLQAEKIRHLLSETTLSLAEIARLTGFSDRYSMSKFFKRVDGMPPASYRAAILE